jgi:GAF domain-containing protein
VAMRMKEQAALYQCTDQLFRAKFEHDIYNAALDAIIQGLDCDRASILLFDEAGVTKFVAWRGLSEGYRSRPSRGTRRGHATATIRSRYPSVISTLASLPILYGPP